MNKRKWLSLLVSMAMMITMLPPVALAEGESAGAGLCPHHTVHTGACGYAEGESPCAYACPVCPVQALIDALPGADSITADNASEVGARLDEIDAAKLPLADSELDALDFAKYDATIAALSALAGQPGAAQPVLLAAAADVPYLNADGTAAACPSAEGVADSDTAWAGGWYVASGSVQITDRVTVSGDVHLILEDGCTLTVSGGIDVSEGNSLTIYAQSTGAGMGALIVQDVEQTNAGIGGSNQKNGGSITINGGTVSVTGSTAATSDGCGAGIGGGWKGAGGVITINGGTVTANGGGDAAGIGGGMNAAGGSVTISGGIVAATGSNTGAGIGGYGGTGGSITISGGTVTAYSGNVGAAGIGGGKDAGSTGSFSTGTNGSAVIYAKVNPYGSVTAYISDQTGKSTWSGIIFEGSSGQVYGTSLTLTEDLTIESGTTLKIPQNKTLTIPDGVTLTNNGTLQVSSGGTLSNSGTITNNGDLKDYGTLNNSGTLGNNGTLAMSTYGTLNNSGTLDNNAGGAITIGTDSYYGTLNNNAGGTLNNNAGGTLTINAKGTLTNKDTFNENGTFINNGTYTDQSLGSVRYLDEHGAEQTAACQAALTASNIGSYTTLPAGWYVVKGEVAAGSRVTISGEVHLILADGCSFCSHTGSGAFAVRNGVCGREYLCPRQYRTPGYHGQLLGRPCLHGDHPGHGGTGKGCRHRQLQAGRCDQGGECAPERGRGHPGRACQ